MLVTLDLRTYALPCLCYHVCITMYALPCSRYPVCVTMFVSPCLNMWHPCIHAFIHSLKNPSFSIKKHDFSKNLENFLCKHYRIKLWKKGIPRSTVSKSLMWKD